MAVYHHGILAAELEDQSLEVLTAGLHDLLPRGRAPLFLAPLFLAVAMMQG